MSDITSANAVFVIAVPLLLPVPQQLQGFGTDDIFDTEDVQSVETMMGVDGSLSAGFIFVKRSMTITLMAGSASNAFFDSWNSGQQAGLIAAPAFATLTLPSLGLSYALSNGYLERYKPIADAKKMLQPRKFTIAWQNILATPVGQSG